MDNFKQAERIYHTEDLKDPTIIGNCVNCLENKKTFTVLTEDYEAYIDCEGNLFCSTECALEFHDVKEVE
ncbi:MAG: hypothetical protein M0R40_00505 [Firmicutes bacterium]|nr:hypothetical protein [Bacillota bacterium]